MDGSFKGKSAVVTGGTRGIGRAIAEALLKGGAGVAICGRTEEAVGRAVEELAGASGGKVVGKVADVSKPEDVEAFFRLVDQSFDGLDILINNAGVGVFRPMADLTPEEWQAVIGTNLSGAFYCSREAIPRFRRRGGGFVVNISSLAGRNPIPGGSAYNASKFGLNGFSEAMMLDHRYDNVRVSYVMPGSVSTQFGMRPEGDWMIAPGDVAEIVMTILGMPERTLISRVEVRPSKPRK
jgi:NAD(P)-dependent dehydrogenase (short-subunit alcohol dehydrogenase family)